MLKAEQRHTCLFILPGILSFIICLPGRLPYLLQTLGVSDLYPTCGELLVRQNQRGYRLMAPLRENGLSSL